MPERASLSVPFQRDDYTSHLSYAYDNTALLQWLFFLRVVVATFILGTVFLVGFPEVRYFFFFLIATHVLTALLSALFIQPLGNRKWFLLVQVYWDVFFVTVLIFISGGIYSAFTFLYILSVIYGAILLTRPAVLLVSLVIVFVSGAMILAQWKGVIPVPNFDVHFSQATFREVVNKLALNSLAIFATAFLSSFLSNRSKAIASELKRKQDDLAELQVRFEHMIRSIPIGLLALDG